jgi:hypothetical protein
MSIIPSTVKSYIAGFLDADGCIMFQLVKREDYRYGFQIRASIVFYQKTNNKKHLEWIKNVLGVGYIRDRNDHMTEYTIVGLNLVIKILELLKPYIRLKKPQVHLANKIYALVSDKCDLNQFIKAAELVDKFGELNYSKRRSNTSLVLKAYLRQHDLYPCND